LDSLRAAEPMIEQRHSHSHTKSVKGIDRVCKPLAAQ
jgi:hypothetical protein